jgi:hydroxymethylbilane synthase
MILRLGTRGSLLARMQSELMAGTIRETHPGVRVELVICKTTGDIIQDKPLNDLGGKGLFTKELEQALLAGEIDCAVHSLKDVPVTMPMVDVSQLVLAAIPERADARDVLISARATRIADLPKNAMIGTSSLRRRCQLLALRGDLKIEPIRGNIDTRLAKTRRGDFDATLLARAGLHRANLLDATDIHPIPLEDVLPAAGQGALAIQCRTDDARTRALLDPLDDAATRQCVELERAVVLQLNGDCHSPIAVLATIENNGMVLRAAIGARGGQLPVIRASAKAELKQSSRVLNQVIEQLEAQNVRGLLSNPE